MSAIHQREQEAIRALQAAADELALPLVLIGAEARLLLMDWHPRAGPALQNQAGA